MNTKNKLFTVLCLVLVAIMTASSASARDQWPLSNITPHNASIEVVAQCVSPPSSPLVVTTVLHSQSQKLLTSPCESGKYKINSITIWMPGKAEERLVLDDAPLDRLDIFINCTETRVLNRSFAHEELCK